MADMDSVINPKLPEVPKPVSTSPSAKPSDKTTPPRNDQGKFTPAPKGDKPPEGEPTKDPVALRKRLTELETETKQLREQRQTEISSLQSKIAEMEKRKYLTSEQEQQQQRREQRLAQLEAETYAQDYSKSPEFETKYKAAWNKRYAEVAEEVKILSAKTEDGETRQATLADWQKVLNAPNRTEARRLARDIFGDDADAIIEHRNALKGIEDQANTEIDTRRKNWNDEKNKWEAQQQGVTQEWQHARSTFDQAIAEKYPEYFGPDPAHPEFAEALNKGLAFVDTSLQQAATLPPQEHAARVSLIRMWAGAFPRLVAQVKDMQTQLTAKDAEIAKYRKSDPGGGGDIGGGSGGAKSKGTDDLAAEFANV